MQNESNDARVKQHHLDDMSAAMGFQDSEPVAKKQSVVQARVSCQNSVNTMVGRVTQAKRDVEDKALVCQKLYDAYISDLVEGSALHSATEAKQELDSFKSAFLSQCDSLLTLLNSRAAEAKQAQDVQALGLLKAGANEELLGLYKTEGYKSWSSTLVAFRRNFTEKSKMVGRNSAPGNAAPPPAPKCFHAVADVLSSLGTQISASLFEAKAGMRAAEAEFLATAKVGSKSLELRDIPLVKKAERAMAKSLAVQTYVLSKVEAAQAKKFDRTLRLFFTDPSIFQTYAVSLDAAWGSLVQAKQFYACKAPRFHIGYCQFGAMELRAVIVGDLVVLGISYAAVPGDSLKEKRAYLSGCAKEELEKIVKSDGWITELKAGDYILIPTGCIVMQLCPAEFTFGIRWTVAADEQDRLRTAMQLGQLLDQFVETRSSATGYSQFQEFLKST